MQNYCLTLLINKLSHSILQPLVFLGEDNRLFRLTRVCHSLRYFVKGNCLFSLSLAIDITSTVGDTSHQEAFQIPCQTKFSYRRCWHVADKPAVERSMTVKRQESAAQYRAEGNERAAKIETEGTLAADKLIASAKGEALRIRGNSKAEVKRIEAESMALNEDLYWRIQNAEIAQFALQGSTLILPSTHPLTKVFDLVGPGDKAQKDDGVEDR